MAVEGFSVSSAAALTLRGVCHLVLTTLGDRQWLAWNMSLSAHNSWRQAMVSRPGKRNEPEVKAMRRWLQASGGAGGLDGTVTTL